MAKTLSELIEEQKAFKESKLKDISLADSTSTRAPSELSTAGVIQLEDEDDDKYQRLAESIAGEVGGSIALSAATTPLLGGGPFGWGVYIAANGLGNLGLNYWAQSHRDPDAEWSPEEGLATTAISTVGPLATYKKVSQLSRIGKVGVAAGEGAVMGTTEDLLRQGLEIGTGKRKDGIDVQQLGFSGAAGGLFGGAVGYLTSGTNFNKLGASEATVDKIKSRAEANAAKRILAIDNMLKNPEVTGEYKDLLLKERDEIKEAIETIRLGDKEYIDKLREQAEKEEQEGRQFVLDRINKLKEPEVGEGTVLRPKEEIEVTPKEQPKTVEPEAWDPMEVPLGIRRTPVIEPELAALDDEALELAQKQALKDAEPLEDEFFGYPTKGAWFTAPKDLARRLGEAQDKVTAIELEIFRRQIDTEEPWFVAIEFNKLTGATEDAENTFKLALLGETIQKRGIQKEVAKELEDKFGRGADAQEVLISKIETAQKAMKTMAEQKKQLKAPMEAPTAEKGVEPEIAPQPTQPTKLTPEQKLEALERMGMSDEDLSNFLEGKSEILPLNLAAFTTDEGVQRSMAAILEQLGDKIKSSRIKTDKESLIKQVVALRKKLDPELDEAKFAQQIAKESEDIIFKTALADSMAFTAFQDWYKKVDAITDLNDPAVATKLMADLDRLQVFVEAQATISSSSGKLLQSRKISKDQIAANINTLERKATKAEKQLVEELVKYPDQLNPTQLKEQLEKLGGLKNVKAYLSELKAVRDPHKLGKLLEISKRSRGERFGRVAKELIYDAVLSAPPTQTAAASGNAMMSLYSLFNQGVGGLATGNLEQTRMALRTTKYLMYGMDDALQAARLAATNSQGSMSLNNHYEKIGEKALSMEATGLSGPMGETVENVGELLNFGPKGLVFQDEFYRHLFGKAQARALLAEEYKQLVKRGEAPVGQLTDYMESRLSRYFVDGKRFKTKNDVELEAIAKANEQKLEPTEAKDFITNYVSDNWTNKLSSEIEYMKDFGDKITFQRELSSEYGWLEGGAAKLGEIRQENSVVELVQLFLRTPTNMFMELGGTLSGGLMIPGMSKVTFRRTLEELKSDNPSIRAQARGRQIVGAGLWASALYLADQQIFTGAGPQDYKERETKMSTGWEPFALNASALKRQWDTGNSGGDQLGDTYIPLNRLGAIADVYGIAATALRAWEDNSMPDDWKGRIISSAQLALTTLIADKTYLANISELNDGLFRGKWEEGGKSGVNALFNAINRMVTPSIMKAAAQLNDPYLRQINEPMDQFKLAFAKARRELDPKRDELGQPKIASQFNSIRESLNYLSPLRIESLKTKKADKEDVKDGRADKVGEMIFTKNDEALGILAEVGGRFKFTRPTDGVPGLDLRKFKVKEDYGFGLNQTLYDRWQQLYSEMNPAKFIIKAYNNPTFQKIGEVPKGSPITNARRLTIESMLSKLRKAALGKLIQETPELKEQYKLVQELQRKTLLEGETAPRKVVADELLPLLD